MAASWESLLASIAACERCQLSGTRTHVVPGEGDVRARLMCIGEGPGQQEDLQGRPFVGPAGQLLDKMLAAIGLARAQVYIANVVKCRPPGNRKPEPAEALACLPFLRAQVALVRPQVIMLLGAAALQLVLGQEHRISRERGIWIERHGTWMMPTYHPAALLRDASLKVYAWQDLQAVRDKLQALAQADMPQEAK